MTGNCSCRFWAPRRPKKRYVVIPSPFGSWPNASPTAAEQHTDLAALDCSYPDPLDCPPSPTFHPLCRGAAVSPGRRRSVEQRPRHDPRTNSFSRRVITRLGVVSFRPGLANVHGTPACPCPARLGESSRWLLHPSATPVDDAKSIRLTLTTTWSSYIAT